jgi:hypothetical protein
MSAARQSVVAAFVGAWNRQDLAAALELVDEDFEYVNPPNAVEPGTRRGTEGVSLVLSKQWEALGEDALMEIDRTHHRDDHLITEISLSRGMPESTARIEVQAVIRWTFDGDRMIRAEVLGAGMTYAEALADAGVAS